MKGPLDIHFNIAVLHISNHLFPCGFDISDNAPDTYEKLCALLSAHNRMVVWSGGSEATIYGDPAVNYAFRAWHDWCHWSGKHDFSLQGERAAYAMQCEHLIALYGMSDQTARWHRILYAEVIGQRLHFDRLGYFPDDQRAFTETFFLRPTLMAAE